MPGDLRLAKILILYIPAGLMKRNESIIGNRIFCVCMTFVLLTHGTAMARNLANSSPYPPVHSSMSSGGETMLASFYGGKWDGCRTASGERFDAEGFSAAHKTLPFGTLLDVTNPANGRTVRVVVNNRGPYAHGRELDLSYGAARKLGILSQGVARLQVREAGHDKHYDHYITLN